ncbi:MAG TPA: hypothetical protein VII01_02975 [Solirubrobacteraceae bacterium]
MPDCEATHTTGAQRPVAAREWRAMLIARRLLVTTESFGPSLPAHAAAEAIGRGLLDGGLPEPDLCPLETREDGDPDPRTALDAVGFDARMRSSWALLVVAASLRPRTLAGSMAFELATRARQAGVPAYAVTADNRLDGFDARVMDLQAILEAAPSARGLRGAARRLASQL